MKQLIWAARTSRGGRPVNEDSWRAQTQPIGCFLVADGLGGHGGGDIASAAVADAVLPVPTGTEATPQNALWLVSQAADALQTRLSQGPASMRSTLTVLLIDGGNSAWAWVGDTRLYLFRGGRARCLTRDHTVTGRLVASGELEESAIRGHEDRSMLLRALGSRNQTPETGEEPVKPGDIFLLCSDGWWEPVLETEMEQLLAQSSTPQDWLDAMEALLEKRADQGSDNRTAVAVLVSQTEK